MLWYTREASVAVYVPNMPMIWPLLREYIPFLRSIASRKASSLPAYGNNGRVNNAGAAKGDKVVISITLNRPPMPQRSQAPQPKRTKDSLGKDLITSVARERVVFRVMREP